MTWTTLTILGFAFFIGSINTAAVRPKIVGGDNAQIKNFPYLVSIRFAGRHFCGGSIISDRHILTAAHCVKNFDRSIDSQEVTIHTGATRTTDEGTVYRIFNYESHSGYNRYDSRTFHDIAIITLAETIKFNKYQQKIKIPSHDVQYHQVAYAAGWGKMKRWDLNTDRHLQKVKLVLLPVDKCQEYVTKELRKEQLCSFRSFGTGPCHGDSGGPLITNGEVVGIVSYVEQGKCAEDIPTVYTNVFAYKDYIESVLNKPL